MSIISWWRRRRERRHRLRIATLIAKAAAAETRAAGYHMMFEMEGRLPTMPGHWVEKIADAKAEAVEARSLAHQLSEMDP